MKNWAPTMHDTCTSRAPRPKNSPRTPSARATRTIWVSADPSDSPWLIFDRIVSPGWEMTPAMTPASSPATVEMTAAVVEEGASCRPIKAATSSRTNVTATSKDMNWPTV